MFNKIGKWSNRQYRRRWREADSAAAAAYAVTLWLCAIMFPPPDWSVVYNALVGLFSALLGFAVTALTVFLGFIDRPSLCRLYQDVEMTKQVIEINRSSIRWLMAGAILSLILVIFPAIPFHPFFNFLLLAITSFGLVRFAGCSWLLINLSRVVLNEVARVPNPIIEQGSLDVSVPESTAEPDADTA